MAQTSVLTAVAPSVFLALPSPVVATALGWIALGQSLSPLQVLGAAIVLGSVVFTQAPGRAIAGA